MANTGHQTLPTLLCLIAQRQATPTQRREVFYGGRACGLRLCSRWYFRREVASFARSFQFGDMCRDGRTLLRRHLLGVGCTRHVLAERQEALFAKQLDTALCDRLASSWCGLRRWGGMALLAGVSVRRLRGNGFDYRRAAIGLHHLFVGIHAR